MFKLFLINAKLTYTKLNSNNVQFKFDEYGLLHPKFINIKGQLSRRAFPQIINPPIRNSIVFTYYKADLNNINWEETYVVESTKTTNGKYDVKFKSMAESSISYNIFIVNIEKGSKEDQIEIKDEIKRLDFTPLKST